MVLPPQVAGSAEDRLDERVPLLSATRGWTGYVEVAHHDDRVAAPGTVGLDMKREFLDRKSVV